MGLTLFAYKYCKCTIANKVVTTRIAIVISQITEFATSWNKRFEHFHAALASAPGKNRRGLGAGGAGALAAPANAGCETMGQAPALTYRTVLNVILHIICFQTFQASAQKEKVSPENVVLGTRFNFTLLSAVFYSSFLVPDNTFSTSGFFANQPPKGARSIP
jgi:hypothetical protein